MIVYVESNFVLELALLQEQSASCDEILKLGRSKQIQLVIPAFSLAEPQSTLHRRKQTRVGLRESVEQELRQLSRSISYSKRVGELTEIAAIFTESTAAELARLQEVVSAILDQAEIVSLDASIVAAALQLEMSDKLPPLDSIVFASVVTHLKSGDRGATCFLNRNTADFDDPAILADLRQLNCRLIPRFDDGLEFIKSELVKPPSTTNGS